MKSKISSSKKRIVTLNSFQGIAVAAMIITSLFLLSNFSTPINAKVDLTTASEIRLDETIKREDTNYSLPTKITVVPLVREELQQLDSTSAFRGIYYYTIESLGFNDIPFHYVVAEDGKIFQGNAGGSERKVLVEGIGDESIFVLYIPQKSNTKFSGKGLNSLGQLLSELTNENSIKPERISISGVKFVQNIETRSVSIQADEVFGTWNTSIKDTIENLKKNYKPVAKNYKVSVDSLNNNAENIKPGDEVTFTINVSNLTENGIYGGTDSELILSKKSSGTSVFFMNNEWLSTTQVSVVSSDSVLLPFEEGIFEFKVRAPLYVGNVSEVFELRTLGGKKVDANDIEIKLNIQKSDRRIVEILGTETGLLNVRESASSVAPTISEVSPGERFFVTEDAGNGWIQIELSSGNKGWVAGWYTKDIN